MNHFAGISFDEKLDINKLNERCSKWVENEYTFAQGSVRILSNKSGLMKVSGHIFKLPSLKNIKLYYYAASPPDYRHSFSGSGLPYPNEEVAFGVSPNVGHTSIGIDGSYSFNLYHPNSYYMRGQYVKPCVYLEIQDDKGNRQGDIMTVVLSEGIPYRSLTWSHLRKWKDGPNFYINHEQIQNPSAYYNRTQSQILLDSQYPKTDNITNFWNKRPPLPEG